MIFFCDIYVIEAALRPSLLNSSLASFFSPGLQRVKPSVRSCTRFFTIPNKSYKKQRTNKPKFIRTKMNRKPPLTCCCPQQQQGSEGGFHICLALQLLENQNRLHIIFDEKISVLHAHVNVPGKTSEVRRALKRSFKRSKSSTLTTCKNEVLIRTALFRSLKLSLRHRKYR